MVAQALQDRLGEPADAELNAGSIRHDARDVFGNLDLRAAGWRLRRHG